MEITVAACSLIDTDTMRQWFEQLNEIVSDEDNDDTDVGMWVNENYDRVEGLWSRLIFAYETIYENACNQTTRILEWKPEIKLALSASSQVSRLREACIEAKRWIEHNDDLGDNGAEWVLRCIHKALDSSQGGLTDEHIVGEELTDEGRAVLNAAKED